MTDSVPLFYSRNLPHWHPQGASIFLTWRLYGSLPQSTARNSCATNEPPGRKFRRIDAMLDRSAFGPVWLKEPQVARSVVDAIRKGETLQYFVLHAFVLMPNDVHLLMTPSLPIRRIMNGLKGSAARAANSILCRKGKHFWQDESYDHWIRNSSEFSRISNYIEFNPVSAGLVKKPEHWPWSSAHHPTPP